MHAAAMGGGGRVAKVGYAIGGPGGGAMMRGGPSCWSGRGAAALARFRGACCWGLRGLVRAIFAGRLAAGDSLAVERSSLDRIEAACASASSGLDGLESVAVGSGSGWRLLDPAVWHLQLRTLSGQQHGLSNE